MVAETVPIKTSEGQAELSARQRSVSQRHRTVLFLVDGRRDAFEVRSMARQAGVPDTCFDDLVELGLISLPGASAPAPLDQPAATDDALPIDVPVPAAQIPSVAPDSILPPSRSLYPDSSMTISMFGEGLAADPWLPADPDAPVTVDEGFVGAKLLMLRSVRAEAPVAGSLTVLRLRRARNRADLSALLDEVEARITTPQRSLAAAQTMRRVRQLLDDRADPGPARA